MNSAQSRRPGSCRRRYRPAVIAGGMLCLAAALGACFGGGDDPAPTTSSAASPRSDSQGSLPDLTSLKRGDHVSRHALGRLAAASTRSAGTVVETGWTYDDILERRVATKAAVDCLHGNGTFTYDGKITHVQRNGTRWSAPEHTQDRTNVASWCVNWSSSSDEDFVVDTVDDKPLSFIPATAVAKPRRSPPVTRFERDTGRLLSLEESRISSTGKKQVFQQQTLTYGSAVDVPNPPPGWASTPVTPPLMVITFRAEAQRAGITSLVIDTLSGRASGPLSD